MRSLSEEAERLIAHECESMRREFEERLEEALLGLTQRELQAIVQVI